MLITQTRTIVSRALAANLMLLIDRSASMATNTSTDPPCPATIGGCGPGNPCPAGCPTRLSDLQSALGNFIDQSKSSIRFGVTVFPKDDLCAPADQSAELVPLPPASLSDDDASLQQQASLAKAAIDSITLGGSTPTADSLRFLAGLPELIDPMRQNFVLLVTDGAPDCNANNPNTCDNPVACRCVENACSTANGFCALGCLDDENATAAVTELRQRDVKTIVAALGPDVETPYGNIALNKLAQASGFAVACPGGTDAECGADSTCNPATRLCSRAYLHADDASELFDSLLPTASTGDPIDVCDMVLDANPRNLDGLSVFVNGALEAPCESSLACNSWVFDASSGVASVRFFGSTCHRLVNATTFTPVTIRVEIVQ